jgi:cysteine desulfurase
MDPVYLDTAATTQTDRRVADAVYRYMVDEFGNAGSRTHQRGTNALQAVENARRLVASVVNADLTDVVFTSGATEANNLATLGLEEFGLNAGRRHVVSTSIEHKAILEPLARLADRGFEVELVDPDDSGAVTADAVLSRVRSDTLLVSMMHVNNETGVIQPIEDVAAQLPEAVFMHVDAAQSFGKLLSGLKNPRVDLISISAHKIFGPKGIGALIVRRRNRVRPPISPLTLGGGQERGLRSGTQSVPLIVGLGMASELALIENSDRIEACERFGEVLHNALLEIGGTENGTATRCSNILNMSIPGLDSEAVILMLKGVADVSNGSACTSSKYEPSHVLRAMGLSKPQIMGAVRFSWDHTTNIAVIEPMTRALLDAR